MSVWYLKKSDGSERVNVDSHKFNQPAVLITAAVLDMGCLLDQFNKASGGWRLPLLWQIPLLFHSNWKRGSEIVHLHMDLVKIFMYRLPPGFANFSVLCHNIL